MALQQHRSLMKKPCYAGIAMLVLALCASPGFAADLIADYFSGLNTFQSSFTQTVTDSNGERVQDAQGRVWMQRPGRFRWDYETPYRQLIVADGERLWTYDEDLEQATVEPVDEALSSTPAMLMSGFKPLDEVMSWVETGSRDGKTWYRLDPKQQDSAVEEVQIAFDAGQLAIIEVRDGFRQPYPYRLFRHHAQSIHRSGSVPDPAAAGHGYHRRHTMTAGPPRPEFRPLADRMRPRNLDEFIGQAHLLGAGKPLRQAVARGQLHSMVFWGPPGTGKTTLAHLLADASGSEFVPLSAVLAGVKDVRHAVQLAQQRQQVEGRGTLLFVDEVHRFNKAQQDAFLPFVEDGTVVFVGATTENPSFELNNALLSRARTYVLKRLSERIWSRFWNRRCATRNAAWRVSASRYRARRTGDHCKGGRRRCPPRAELAGNRL